MSTDIDPTTVVLRSPQRVGLAIGWLVIAVATVLLHFTVSPSASLGLAGFFTVLAVVTFLISRWIGVVLTPAGLVDRGITIRRVSWSDIQTIEQTTNIATRYVVVHTHDGRHQQLRLPTIALGTGEARFNRDVAQLNCHWVQYRGTDWRPIETQDQP